MKVTLTLFALFSFAFAKPNLSGKYYAFWIKKVLQIIILNFSLDVPTIKVSQARSKGSVPEMQITFADGHEDKLILHRHLISGAERMMDEEMTCNYLGHLENDASACVAVTGCIGQDMELTINSKHNTKTNIYLLQKSGDVQLLPRPFSVSLLSYFFICFITLKFCFGLRTQNQFLKRLQKILKELSLKFILMKRLIQMIWQMRCNGRQFVLLLTLLVALAFPPTMN